MRRRSVFVVTFITMGILLLTQVASTPVQAQIDTPVTSFHINCDLFHVTGTFSDGAPLFGADHVGAKYPGLTAWVDYNGDNFVTLNEIFVTTLGGGTPSGDYAGVIDWPRAPEGTFIFIDLSTYMGPYTDFATQYIPLWDREVYIQGGFRCFNDIPGPAIPEGAELKTIVCNVAVYNTAGGEPVGANQIKSGQTWYVLPGVKMGQNPGNAGSIEWSEVFVGGHINGWIPTACVQNANRGEEKEATTSGSAAAAAGGSQRASVAGTPLENPVGGGDAFIHVPFSFGLGRDGGGREALAAKVRR